MTHEYALALLKADLGFYTVSGPVSDLLESKLKAAEKAIAKMGITIDMEDGDDLKGAITDGKLVQATGGITQRMEQSDKLGFDWRIFTVNDVDVRKDYVEQENPVGTSADNPIEYTEGVPLINNAFYRVDGVIKVYMDSWVDWEG